MKQNERQPLLVMICPQSLQLTQKRRYSLLLFLSLSQQVLLSDDPAAWSSSTHGEMSII